MALPELIYAPLDGGTIHRYEISGGKRKFLRFIGCYLGQCNFHKNVDDAIDYIKNLKESQKIQKTWNKDTYRRPGLSIFQELNNYCYKVIENFLFIINWLFTWVIVPKDKQSIKKEINLWKTDKLIFLNQKT